MGNCNNCILSPICDEDQTHVCQADIINNIPDKCRFCEVRRERPVEKGGECLREEDSSIAKRSTIKPE